MPLRRVFSESPLLGGTAIIVVADAVIRLYFGVNFIDEALYAAIPYRMILGDRLFFDELNITQTAAPVIYPFIFLWVKLTGGTDGIILFNRYLFLIFTVLMALTVYSATKESLGRALAGAVSLICIIFIPYISIPSMSYCTQGSGFLTLGLILLFKALNRPPSSMRWHLAGIASSGLFLGLAITSYPPLLAGLLFCLPALLFIRRDRRIPSIIAFGMGLALVGIVFLALIPYSQLADVNRYAAAQGYGSGVANSFAALMQKGAIIRLLQKLALLCGAFVVARACRRRLFPQLVFLIGSAAALRAFLGGQDAFYVYFSYMAIFFVLGVHDRVLGRNLLLAVWLPSFAGSIAMSWYRGNLLAMNKVTVLPAVVATLCLFGLAIRDAAAADSHSAPRRTVIPRLSELVLCALLLSLVNQSPPSLDAPRSYLSVRMKTGPFRGIYTSPDRSETVRQIQDDIAALASTNRRILFFPTFVAGYLMTGMRPAIRSVWGCLQPDAWGICETYYDRVKDGGVVIVDMKDYAANDGTRPDGSAGNAPVFRKGFRENYRKRISREHWDVYTRDATVLGMERP